jgi:hypothetical protein
VFLKRASERCEEAKHAVESIPESAGVANLHVEGVNLF